MSALTPEISEHASGLPPRRLTRDLLRAMELANMLATSRASSLVEISDVLAGMYLDNWERLSRFWTSTDNVDTVLRQLCQISAPRWQKWMGDYHAMRAQFNEQFSEKPKTSKARPDAKKNGVKAAAKLEISSDLKQVFRAADRVAPYSDRVNNGLIPIVSTECLLLCIAQDTNSAIGRKLLSTGLDLAALEKAVRYPKHAPI